MLAIRHLLCSFSPYPTSAARFKDFTGKLFFISRSLLKSIHLSCFNEGMTSLRALWKRKNTWQDGLFQPQAGFPVLSFSYQVALHISGLTCAVLEIHTFLIYVSSSPLSFPSLSSGYLRPFLFLYCCLEAKSAWAVAVSSLKINSSKVEIYQRKVISIWKINKCKIQSF